MERRTLRPLSLLALVTPVIHRPIYFYTETLKDLALSLRLLLSIDDLEKDEFEEGLNLGKHSAVHLLKQWQSQEVLHAIEERLLGLLQVQKVFCQIKRKAHIEPFLCCTTDFDLLFGFRVEEQDLLIQDKSHLFLLRLFQQF